MKLTSYWLDTSEPFRSAASGPVAGHCDVAVIGGGLTGSSAALALARKGARVVLLEAETIGHAASGRNGGMCNNGFAQDYGVMSARIGKDAANTLYRAFDAGVDMVERLVREEQIDCSFARVGKIKLAAKPEHYDKLARGQALLAANVDAETWMVSKADLSSEVGSQRYYGGLVYGKSATMHVGRFVRGLAEAAARQGVEIHERTPMTGLKPASGGGHVIDTPKGRLNARQVLLASGTSHTGPLGWIRRRIVPVGAFLIVTEPLPIATLDRLLPRRRNAVDTKNLVTYFRTTPDNRLLLGGRARFAVSNPASDQKSGAILQASLHDVFPELRSARIDYCWGGMVDMTRDRLPRAGERNGIYYSMGYSGHGTQMSTLMGTIMAEVMDGRVELNPWKDFDWPAIPGHFGSPWFLPLVGAYYRIKDRFQ
ncbi:NAD(P)/FAD-dependent oxidoreductase [Bosea psychrotolerans]|uniref:Glycine/D-amino acid oxidase-like deaminating enzyme n=1 Tax=Bosea psychrotolerans TaxID=1871628 RepID=A0A2S4MAD3_9HYPH|nr:FAD-binding oxidoreductase [Bosea psychrotolerans]POR51467.1 glycine/D-amino acid oxidase-like deaminating enzyme [Bosea psychrotolerans]